MSGQDDRFLLLNDLPVEDRAADLLGTAEVAGKLADLVHGSRGNTPFVLAIDGHWGSGKSTLMRQLASALRDREQVEVVWFNAWTASGANALNGMLRLVLDRLDPNVVRRSVRSLRRRGLLTGTARVGLTVLARFFGADRAIDELWQRMAVDAKAREEARELLKAAVTSWVDGSTGQPRRTIAVFIDDLDRCSERTAIEICEAIKLYLDLPGIAFVLGCDLSVLARIPVPGAEGPAHVRQYLEKIVQISYQIPVPTESAVHAMITGYALRSRTGTLLTERLIPLIIRPSEGNPRRVKRLVNSFVAEYRLDPGWAEFGAEGLMKAVILQHFHPDFYQEVLRGDGDTVGDLLDYAQARDALRRAPSAAHLEGKYDHVLARWAVRPPENLLAALTELDERVPPAWRALADDDDFLSLLRDLGDGPERNRLQQRLRRRPLSTAPTPLPPPAAGSRLDGLRLLWIDDNPAGNERLIDNLTARGVQVRTALTGEQAAALVRTFAPNVVLSDVNRNGLEAGFDELALVRDAGYSGPVCFFAGYVDADRRARAEALGAPITASEVTVVEWLEAQAVASSVGTATTST
jgi:CheY-like chemotaxis protein